MEQNKTGKYFKYAIGEIVLVVIGILIALSINNWNQERINRQKIDLQLEALIQSLEDQKSTLEYLRILHMFRYHSMQYLLKFAEKPLYEIPLGGGIQLEEIPYERSWLWEEDVPEDYNRKFIDYSFTWSGRFEFGPPNTKITDELDRSGAFALIGNLELKDALDDFYLAFKWRITNESKQIGEKWKYSLIDDGVLFLNPQTHNNPIDLISQNPERAALLTALAGQAHWISSSAKDLTPKVDKLIQLIEDELDE